MYVFHPFQNKLFFYPKIYYIRPKVLGLDTVLRKLVKVSDGGL